MHRKSILGKRRIQQLAKSAVASQFPQDIVNIEADLQAQPFTIPIIDTEPDNISVSDYSSEDCPLTSDSDEQAEDNYAVSQAPMPHQLKRWAQEQNVNQSQLSSLLKILKQHPCFSTLPSDGRSLLSTQRQILLAEMPPGHYIHFGLHECLLKEVTDLSGRALNLQLSTDGLPLFKSKCLELWPIFGFVLTISRYPFIIGIYCGPKKPENSNVFLAKLVSECNVLTKDGFDTPCGRFSVCIHSFICDAPAKAFIKGIKGHTGYSGCDKCITSGDYDNNRIHFSSATFSETLRSNQSFRSKTDEDHHLKTSQ